MSGRRDDDDENQENLMLLRLPEKYAQIVRQAVHKGNLRERLEVDIKDDCRHALVKVENIVLPAKIVDLPCVVECQKTIDKKTFYKSGDICQMLLVSDTPIPEEEVPRNQGLRKEKIEHKKYVYPHGVCPPFKNVRKKRFRKTAPKKIIDDPEVEKEVRRLLRADISAISVTTEIIYDNQKPEDAARGEGEEDPDSSQRTDPNKSSCDISKILDDTLTEETPKQFLDKPEGGDIDDGGLSKELFDMFQDVSSDDADSSADEGSTITTRSELENRAVSAVKSSDMMITTASQEAHYELETLDRKIKGLEVEVERTGNSFLKQRLRDDLEKLKRERDKKQMEID